MADPQTAQVATRCRATMVADLTSSVVFKSGEGCRFEDLGGNRYIDFIGGYGVVNTGWQRPEILDALAGQIGAACFAPPWLPTRESADLAEALLALAPPSVAVCARATGGAEANEVAVKAHFAHRGWSLLVI